MRTAWVGRVAVFAATLDCPSSFLAYHIIFLNETRRHQLVAILDWLNRGLLPAIVLSDVELYVRHGVLAPAAGGGELLAIFNMNMDPLPALRLRLGGQLVSKIAKLNGDGTWMDLEWRADSGTELTVNTPVESMVPLLLRLT